MWMPSCYWFWTQDLAVQQILSSIDLFLFYRTDYTDSRTMLNRCTGKCVRLSRPLVGFWMHFKSPHFHFIELRDCHLLTFHCASINVWLGLPLDVLEYTLIRRNCCKCLIADLQAWSGSGHSSALHFWLRIAFKCLQIHAEGHKAVYMK